MKVATCALLLWAVTTACSLSVPLNCIRLSPYAKLLKRSQHCSVTYENGYVIAVCNIHVFFSDPTHFYDHAESLMMEQVLLSIEPVGGETINGSIVCLSLHSIKIAKGDKSLVGKNCDVVRIDMPMHCGWAANMFTYLLKRIPRFTLKSTFDVPPQAAVAVCNGIRGGGGCNFEVHDFIDSYQCNSRDMPYFREKRKFFKFWNIRSVRLEYINITFLSTQRTVPRILFDVFSLVLIKRLTFYKCKFSSIELSDLWEVKNLKRLDFFHAPIHNIHPLALSQVRYFIYLSLVDTNLPGIPEAILYLRLLKTLDMSDTEFPRGTKFQYYPEKVQLNSSVQELILSRTNLTSLPNRAFCGFPLLKSLELENCHIAQLSGSPFECLEHLSNLTMPGNKFKSLDGQNVRGLKKLDFLNLSNNLMAHFDGQQIFPTLISLKNLILSQNEITNLPHGSVEDAPIEQLNLAYNRLSKWKTPLFARMSKLKTLVLEHNGLSGISEDMLLDIRHIDYVDLSWNLWDCSSCQTKNLRSVLDKHPSQCTDCFLCKEPEEYEGMFVLDSKQDEDACGPPDYFRIYGVPALLFVMTASVVGYAIYRNRWYCMYGLLYIKVAVKGRRRQAQIGRFLWDGFVSYHASDAKWVRDVLLPKLESAPTSFRLCVSERDFIPGLPITENILRAIAQSRVSLFVLSREFCRSRWCMFEVRLAQHRLFENDRHDSIVFISKDDVEVSEMSPTLAYLINTRTYVPLPSDSSSEALNSLFWLQVQAALEH